MDFRSGMVAVFAALLGAKGLLAQSEPQVTGAWSPIIELPLVAVAMANLPDGKVLMWAANLKTDFDGPFVNKGETWTAIWDPENPGAAIAKLIDTTDHDMFCPGTNVLPDGRVLISGGSGGSRTTIYNPNDDSWERGDEMIVGRGYQSNTLLPDGSVFTFGGSWYGGWHVPASTIPPVIYEILFFLRYYLFGWFFDLFLFKRKDGEVWDAMSEEWRELKNVRCNGSFLTNDGQPQSRDNHMWLFTAPNGNVFHAGPSKMMHWISVEGKGSTQEAGLRGNDHSMNGNAIMYDIGKILCFGGAPNYELNTQSHGEAVVIDLNNGSSVQVQQVGSLNYARTMMSSAVLPTGHVVVVGGIEKAQLFNEKGAVLTAEIWNPDDQQFHSLADIDVARTYHSSAILLMDGRVLVAGGGLCGTCEVNRLNGQILTPPYLYDASGNLAIRPVIVNAPSDALPGDTISVVANTAIAGIALVRQSASTHSTNNDLRRIPLSLTILDEVSNTYTAQLPSSSAVCLPGTYFLFVMDENGVPSMATTIMIGTLAS